MSVDASRARTMGHFQAPGVSLGNGKPEEKRLATLHRTERCENCRWPETCAGDETCWREEAEAKRAQQAADRQQRALDALDSGERVPQEAASESAPAEPDEQKSSRRSKWPREQIIELIQQWADEHGAPPTVAAWTKKLEGYPTCSTVSLRFGSWANAIEAAGFERPVRGGKRGQSKPKAPVTHDDQVESASGFAPSDEEEKTEPVEPESHEWAHELRRAILDDPITITVDAPLPEHGMRLMDTLGVTVVLRRRAPEPEREPVTAPPPAALARVGETLTMPALNVLEDPERSQPFVAKCESMAERYEAAAAALRQIVAGVRALEELSR